MGNEEDKINKFMLFCITNQKDKVESLLNTLEPRLKKKYLSSSNNKGFTPLHLASARGYKDIVNILINNGANILAKDKNDNTALHLASLNGHYDVAKLLMNIDDENEEKYEFKKIFRGYSVFITRKENLDNFISKIEKNYERELGKRLYFNAENKDKDTPLHLACKNNHKKIVELLLSNNLIIKGSNSKNMTPLDYACCNRNENIVNILVDNMPDECIEQQFIVACQFNNKTKIELMLLSNKVLNLKDALNKGLFYVVINENIDILDLLLKNGANINSIDKKERTPIFKATNEAVLLRLIEGNADLNWKDKEKNTVLFCNCLIRANENIVKILLEKGVNVNERNGTNKWTALHAACLVKQNFNIVKILLEYNAKINIKDKKGNTVIHMCCNSNNIVCLEYILNKRKDIDLNIKNNEGNTPLHVAVSSSYKELVSLLISKGVNLNIENSKGMTPIYYACVNGDIDIVDMLIEKGAKVNLKSKDFLTPLQSACFANSKQIVSKLLSMRVDISTKNNEGNDALSIAVQAGNIEIQNLLIDNIFIRMLSICESGKKEDLDLVIDKKFQIPQNILNYFLSIACENNNLEIARILIKKGADVNENLYINRNLLGKKGVFVNSEKATRPIHIVAQRGYTDMIKLLMENDANITIKDKDGNTPLILAKRYGSLAASNILSDELVKRLAKASRNKHININIIKNFIEQDINTNLEDENVNTPIVYACKNGRLDIVKCLLENGINLKEDKYTNKMLMNACDSESIDILEYLIENGANINELDENKMTLLMYACKNGYLSIVKYLITKYENLDCKDKLGKTAIIYAIQGNNLNIVKYLSQQGANINYKDNNGVSLIMHACKLGCKGIVKYLLDKCVDIDIVDSYGNNALTYAVKFKYKDIVKYFINYKNGISPLYILKSCCDIDKIDEKEQVNIVKYLMGKIINSEDSKKRNELLMYICKIGKLDLLKLVNIKYIINCVDDKGETLLMRACQFGCKDIVKYLLDKDIDIYKIDNCGNNALAYAAMFGYNDIVKILVEKSGNDVLFIEHKNENGITPLMYARDMLQACYNVDESCYKEQISIIKYLINGTVIEEDEFDNELNKKYKVHYNKNINKCTSIEQEKLCNKNNENEIPIFVANKSPI